MKIRTVDDKNRVTVNAGEQRLYSEHVDDNGTITLIPVIIPDPPKLEKDAMRAIYVSRVPISRIHAATITLHVGLGIDAKAMAVRIAALADEFMSPIVIDPTGLNGPIADLLPELTDQEVIQVHPVLKPLVTPPKA